jgi:hypothetical protein
MKSFSLLASFCALLWLTACDKDKFTTKPQLFLVEKMGNDLRSGADSIKVTLRVTDSEGDVTDTLFVRRASLKCRVSITADTAIKRIIFPPGVPRISNLDFLLDFSIKGFSNLNQTSIGIGSKACTGANNPDSTRLKFWIVDQKKNVSDTLVIDGIRIF